MFNFIELLYVSFFIVMQLIEHIEMGSQKFLNILKNWTHGVKWSMRRTFYFSFIRVYLVDKYKY